MTRPIRFEVHPPTYEWTSRLFTLLRKVLSVNVKLHHDGESIDGDIFLFNHFARFETFIPQYLIYLETGAYCRSIASSEFFIEDDPFSNYLARVGAVPHELPNLLSFLAADILRGRKVVIFPEGGMVKDRRVVDPKGAYSVYSRMALARRKHHTGAAVLALTLDAFKWAVANARDKGDGERIERWAEALGLADGHALVQAALRPTRIVPANITFYPIRVGDNLLRKGAELINRGISRRLSEELLIEGNILLRDTDMDIRLGEPVEVSRCWHWWDRKLIARVASRFDSLQAAFELRREHGPWDERLLASGLRRTALALRDDYMHRMYLGVTVNLSHLASRLVLELVEAGNAVVDEDFFKKSLYLAVKHVQREAPVHLHRSIQNPEGYWSMLDGECQGLEQFLRMAGNMRLIDQTDATYTFLPKLREEHEFDKIRLENLVEVYANEVAPLESVKRAVRNAIRETARVGDERIAELRFDDELMSYHWDKRNFDKPRHREVNEAETATANAEPFLLRPSTSSRRTLRGASREVPQAGKDLGVVLVHGFLASPAEMRGFGEQLEQLGYPSMGVRLKGHGTSPWDLRERSWRDWLASVRRGYEIMRGLVSRVALVGFSTGGALSLLLGAEAPEGLAGIAAVSVPLKFRNRNLRFVPLVHGANRLVSWVSSFEGIMPFRVNESEHPDINYRQMPIRGLYELTVVVEELRRRLPEVAAPVCLVQGSADEIVDPSSAGLIVKLIGEDRARLTMVETRRHGILNEDVGETRATVLSFLAELESGAGGAVTRSRSAS
ncbi:MAG: alpha/beta hydrolase [Gammaproteobacteria bacterium]|nr:alpha/beta hydrolase [Gammaproteobacteria bacterium]